MKTEKLAGILADRIVVLEERVLALAERITALEEQGGEPESILFSHGGRVWRLDGDVWRELAVPYIDPKTQTEMMQSAASRSSLDHPNRQKELDRHPELVVKRTEEIT